MKELVLAQLRPGLGRWDLSLTEKKIRVITLVLTATTGYQKSTIDSYYHYIALIINDGGNHGDQIKLSTYSLIAV